MPTRYELEDAAEAVKLAQSRGIRRAAGITQDQLEGLQQETGDEYNTRVNRELAQFTAQRLVEAQMANSGPRSLARAQAALNAASDQPFAAGAQQDLNQIKPLVQAGVLGPADVQSVVKSAMMGDIADQRNSRKAATAIQAIVTQSANGTFNEQMTASAIASLHQNFPPEMLANVQGYAQLVGKQEEIQQSRIQQTQEFAKQQGIDPSVLKWDTENNRPTLDPHTAQIQAFKFQTEQHEAAKANAVVTNQRKNAEAAMLGINSEMKAISTIMAAQKKTGNVDPGLVSVMVRLAKENKNITRQLIGGAAETESASAPPAQRSMQQASAYPSFDSTDSFSKALGNGQATIGKPVLINGVPWMAYPDKTIRRVR